MTKKKRVKKKEEKRVYDQDLYSKLSINNLILFSLYSLRESKQKVTFERLLKECFSLFPKAFSFSEYKKWPDSRKLDRPLRTLRKKKLISGNPKSYFSLTKSGKKLAEELGKILRQKKLL